MAFGPAFKHSATKLIAFLLILIFCVATGVYSAKAQSRSDWPIDYLAGFAFFKFANVEPDFRTWVLRSPAHENGSPRSRAILLRSEVPRLQNAFSNYVIDDHPITLETEVTIKIPLPAVAKRLAKEEGLITIPIKIVQETGSLFAIQMADMWIALIPEGLDDMLQLRFTEDEYTAFRNSLKDAGYISGSKVRLSLRVLPTEADTQEPLMIKDFQLWMLLAKIISFELRSEDSSQTFWHKNIEGYDKQNSNQTINNLFKN